MPRPVSCRALQTRHEPPSGAAAPAATQPMLVLTAAGLPACRVWHPAPATSCAAQSSCCGPACAPCPLTYCGGYRATWAPSLPTPRPRLPTPARWPSPGGAGPPGVSLPPRMTGAAGGCCHTWQWAWPGQPGLVGCAQSDATYDNRQPRCCRIAGQCLCRGCRAALRTLRCPCGCRSVTDRGLS